MDSLYNGYPAGYLNTWINPSVRLKDDQIMPDLPQKYACLEFNSERARLNFLNLE